MELECRNLQEQVREGTRENYILKTRSDLKKVRVISKTISSLAFKLRPFENNFRNKILILKVRNTILCYKTPIYFIYSFKNCHLFLGTFVNEN